MLHKIWDFGCQESNRKCSLKAVGKELVKCKLDLVGVEDRWHKGDSELADTYAFLYESGKGY